MLIRVKMLIAPTTNSVVVEALCYKPEGHGFETVPTALCPGVHLASNRNEYQKQKNNVFGE
jgi:hypothetical protein